MHIRCHEQFRKTRIESKDQRYSYFFILNLVFRSIQHTTECANLSKYIHLVMGVETHLVDFVFKRSSHSHMHL